MSNSALSSAMQTDVLTRDTIARPARTYRVPSRKRLLAIGAALALAAGAGWYGADWWRNGRFIERTDDAYVGGDVTSLSPHVAGYVEAILVGDNQHVKAGQVMLRIDARDYRAALEHAQAVVAERQASLVHLQAQLVLQQSMIRQAAADVSAKQARAAFAAEDARRYAALAQTVAGSRQDAQRTDAVNLESAAAVQSAQASLAAAEQQVAVLQAAILAAEAQVTEAQSDLRTAQLNLGYTEIRSPIDGYVGNRAVRVGSYVAAGAYLLSVVPEHGLWVDANFKEDQLARMRPGETAEVVADIAPGRAVHGHVENLAPATGAVFSVIPPENATGNFTKIVQRVPVRIVLDPGDANLGTLRPGLSTTVSVDTRVQQAGRP
jgi:membrane fusion protein, multidrug efflux system